MKTNIGSQIVEVEYDYDPGEAGCYSGPPENCYPGYEGGCEVTSVMWRGIDILPRLTQEWIDKLDQEAEAHCLSEMESDADNSAEERFERQQADREDRRTRPSLNVRST